MRLTAKIALLTLAVAISVGLSSAWWASGKLQESLKKELRDRGDLLAHALAESLVARVLQRDVVETTHALRRVVHSNQDMVYIYLIDFDGQVFAHSFDDRLPPELMRGFVGGASARELYLGQQPILEVSYPLVDSMSASLHVGMSRLPMVTAVAESRQQIVMVSLAIGLFVSLLSILFGRQITRPIHDLIRQVARYGRGEIAAIDPSRYNQGGPEVSALADGLSAMMVERERTHQELRNAYGEAHAISEAIHDNLYMLDTRGRLIWWNAQVEHVTGLTADILKGMPAEAFFVPEDRGLMTQAIRKVIDEGYADVEARLLTRNGPVFYQYNGVRVQNAEGEVIGIAGVGRDISNILQAAEELRKLNVELEDRVEERTRHLQLRTEELSLAKDEADRASLAKSEFLSCMSHELRTPLNAVLGFGHLLQLEPLTPDQAESVDEIARAGRHLLDLINQILDLARIESGYLDLTTEAVEIVPLVNECLAMIEPLAEQKRIRLAVAEQPVCHCAVYADRLRLRQVLINLLSNAIKFNQEAGNVLVDCETLSANRIRIRVADTGEGIPETSLPRLFKPFSRLEPAYSGTEGSGIGLALVKQLVEAMGGCVGVESRPGAGSIFWVELPAAKPTALAVPQKADTEPGAPPVTRSRLLYIEDNPANLRLMRRIVEQMTGMILQDAPTAELGLAMAMRQPPDLILLDIGLPGMDGYEALRRLKANPDTQNIPTIAITANAMPTDMKRGTDAGFDEYLTKPLDAQQFVNILHVLLGAKSRPTVGLNT